MTFANKARKGNKMKTILSTLLILFSGFAMGASVYYLKVKTLSAAMAMIVLIVIGFFMMGVAKAIFAGQDTESEKKMLVFSFFMAILVCIVNAAVYVAMH